MLAPNNRPYVILKVAMSLDGRIDDKSPTRKILSCEADRAAVTALRKQCDGILVGAETIRRDNPSLLSSKLKPCSLTKVTITRSGVLKSDSSFFTTGNGKKLVYATSDAEKKLTQQNFGTSTKVVRLPEEGKLTQQANISFILEDLATRGLKTLLVENGGELAEYLLKNNLVDKLRLAIAPQVLHEGPIGRISMIGNNLQLFKCYLVGNTMVLEYVKPN